MPVDASPYAIFKPVNIGDSIESGLRAGADMRKAKLDQQRGEMELGEKRRGLEEDKAIRGLYSQHTAEDGTFDQKGFLGDVSKINPEKAFEYQDKFRQRDSNDLKAKSEKLGSQIEQLGTISNIAMGAKDQGSYDAALGQATKMGFDISNMPKQYDPALVKTYAFNSMKQAERLAAQKEQHDAQLGDEKFAFDKTKESNDVYAKNADRSQRDRLKQAELTGNALLADKRGAQELDQIASRAQEERKTRGEVSADTAARLADMTKNRKEEKASPDQFKVAGFGKRLNQAEDVFNALEKAGFDRTSNRNGLASMMPSSMQSGDMQSQEQAERNYINAVLRRESGAAISSGEFDSAAKQYFPRAGDSPEVVEQKRQNRAQVMASMQSESGPAWEKIPGVDGVPKNFATGRGRSSGGGGGINSAHAAEPPKAPRHGTEDGGYVFMGGDPADQKNWKKAR